MEEDVQCVLRRSVAVGRPTESSVISLSCTGAGWQDCRKQLEFASNRIDPLWLVDAEVLAPKCQYDTLSSLGRGRRLQF
jgi:hypothetical protein